MSRPVALTAVRNARLRDRDGLFDLMMDAGVVQCIVTADAVSQSVSDTELDAQGALLCPPFVDAHLHLDYANTVGQPRVNQSGTLFEAIDIWADHKREGYINREVILANALAAVRAEAANGVGFIRTHVDVTEDDLVGLDAILELKDRVREWCEIQVIAFPQNGIYAYPRGAELIEEALRRGADVVGGIPHFEASREAGVRSLQTIFDLAERYEKLIDVHCDEIDDDQSRFLEVMAELTTERGMQGRVTASHTVAMAYYGPGYLAKLLPKLAAAQINFAINPTENLHLQGWGMDAPLPRGVAPIGKLTDAGLNVALGQDSIADPWYPIGHGDMLHILDVALHVGHVLNEEYLGHCLDFIGSHGARNMALPEYGIAEGNPASFILLDATGDKDALWHHSDVLANVHRGTPVFTCPPRQFQRAHPGFLTS